MSLIVVHHIILTLFAATADRYESYSRYLINCWNRAAPSLKQFDRKCLSNAANTQHIGEINNGAPRCEHTNTPNDDDDDAAADVVHALKTLAYMVGRQLATKLHNRYTMKIQSERIALLTAAQQFSTVQPNWI